MLSVLTEKNIHPASLDLTTDLDLILSTDCYLHHKELLSFTVFAKACTIYVNESQPSGLALRFAFNGRVSTKFPEVSLSSEIQVWLFGVHDQAKLCDVEPLCSCYPFDANSKSLTITRLSAHV